MITKRGKKGSHKEREEKTCKEKNDDEGKDERQRYKNEEKIRSVVEEKNNEKGDEMIKMQKR